MLDFTNRIDNEHVAEVTRRVSLAKKLVANSDPRAGLMTSWRQQNRFWGLHSTLFEYAVGIPFSEVLASIRLKPVKGNDPTCETSARARAVRDVADSIAREKCKEDIVFDSWSRWSFFPEIVREVFELDPDEMKAAVAAYDREISKAVFDFEPHHLAALAKKGREYKERQSRYLEGLAEQKEKEIVVSLPGIHRLEAYWTGREAIVVFEVLEDDLLGHSQLLHPIIGGMWDLLRPWAAHGGMSADYQNGTLTVTLRTAILTEFEQEAAALSEGVRKILAFDPEMTPLISETKAIAILQISRADFRGLSDIGEIAPWQTICIKSGPAAGREFQGYVPREILELKDRLGT